jgi:peptide methionine sulfoxide reductase msrA/msrB
MSFYKQASLTPEIKAIVLEKGTELPFSGEYTEEKQPGTYLCRQCGLALFRAESKFSSQCGWPSFDAELVGSVKQQVDADGRRTEILCARCQAHLGHVFSGEGYTVKNVRHCVNSLSLDFVKDVTVKDTEEAIFAAGCFWGVEYYFKQLPGVVKVEVGYSGGKTAHPGYREVCAGDTGHYEVVRVLYDKAKTNYAKIARYFFEIHNFQQKLGQGPDIGEQYLSVLFYYDDAQLQIARQIMHQLQEKGYQPVTKVLPVTIFWRAEEYHQNYYAKNGKQPYCHRYEKIF